METPGDGWYWLVEYSQDGKQAIVERVGPGELYMVNVQDGSQTLLYQSIPNQEGIGAACWAPDDISVRVIKLSLTEDNWVRSDIHQFNLDGGKQQWTMPVLGEFTQPQPRVGFACSPDGRELAFAGGANNSISILNLDNGEIRLILSQWYVSRLGTVPVEFQP
jgi:WD40 repeat protein